MSQIKLSQILQSPINQDNWPHLEYIIKSLQQFMTQRIKNREYIYAQRAKQKIIEAQEQIKKRNRNQIQRKQLTALQELKQKHFQERNKLDKQWNARRQKLQRQFDQAVDKKKQRQQIDSMKYFKQVQIAIPINNSPDKQLYHLHHQQEQFVKNGNFLQAQRIKGLIQRKQKQLAMIQESLRASNVKIMMGELENKQKSQMLTLLSQKDKKIEECDKMKKKRNQQLFMRQQRQIKQLKWIYGEQKKKIK